MSIHSDAGLTNSRDVQVPELKVMETDHSSSGGPAEKTSLHYDEYTTILKKHLCVVETELTRLKNPQFTDSGTSNQDESAINLKANEKGIQEQKAKILRVAPWAWREVKSQGAIDPELPALIVSSKGHGRVGPRSRRRTVQKSGSPSTSVSKNKEESSFDVAYRVTVNSRILLNLLGECTGVDFPEDRNVWLRPFKYLVAYEAEIRQALQEIEESVAQASNDNQVSTPSGSLMQENRDTDSVPLGYKPHISTVDISYAQVQSDQLRCLVDFMSSDMQDIFDVKRQVDNQTLEEVAFEHLWLLYKPGDLVYTMENLEDRSTYQAYRVLHITGGRSVLDTLNQCHFDPVDDRNWDFDSESEERVRDSIRGSPANITPVIIDCFYIDFDGNKLGPKSKKFAIHTFMGKRRLDTLDLCPSFSFPQHEKLRSTMVARGRRFTQLAAGTHKKYSGTTLRESREFFELNRSYLNYVIHDEEVRSEIMVDQSAAATHYRKALQSWTLKVGGRSIGAPTMSDRREFFDPLPKKHDKDTQSDVFDDSIIDLDRRNDFTTSTALLKYRNIHDSSLSDDYVMLLPFRVYGFAMLNRKWFPLNVNLIEDITPDQVRVTAAGFEDLVLPEGHKKLLRAIVKNQVRDAKQTLSEQEENPEEFQMDLVKGKGKGLIILLHGAPGVGKTATAECVAAQLERPLLPITCGDISTQVYQAEEKLQEYCALAYRWRSVLLLDEADVFLAKREKGEMARNSLVSVFLRVLEYFSGVIILTTNRVGEFDEAFRSRIHVSLYYPKLDRDTTLNIWERSLLRLRKSGLQLDFSEDEIRDFAEQHWHDNVDKPSRRWNGRQIRNAFQTALALANWDFYENKQGRNLAKPMLKAYHFKVVAKTSAHFDDYLSNIHNIPEDTFSVLAARDAIRKDSYTPMSSGQSHTPDFAPRSRRAVSDRRGAGTRNARAEEGRQFEGSARVRQLEIELEILRLNQASGKEEVQARAGDDDADEGW